jgi:hypothetical protein
MSRSAALIEDDRYRRQLLRGLPVNDTGNPAGTACPEGRLLALRCLGIPEVATRTPMSRARALRHRLAAYGARIRPRNTTELASLVVRMGEEIDRRDRMIDAALRAIDGSRRLADEGAP